MVDYRLASARDFEKINSLCEQEGICPPDNNEIVFIAIDTETDNILGITGIILEWRIEPMIAKSPIIAHTLGRMAEASLMTGGAKFYKAHVDENNEKHINQLIRSGMKITDRNKVILRKDF